MVHAKHRTSGAGWRGAAVLVVMLGLLLAGLPEGSARANEAPASLPCLAVRAEGVVRAAPDMARLNVSVRAEATSAGAAMQDVAARVARVLAALEEAGIPARDIQTAALSLGPRHEHRPGQPPRLAGFEANTRIALRLSDLEAVGGLIDSLVAAGAEGLSGLAFDLADSTAPMDAAREKAVAEGLRRARLLAETAGMALGPLLELREENGAPSFAPMMRAEAMAADGVPLAPGELEFRATVTMRFALVPYGE
ncbi:MAG: SIMPL domain-containing protein [Rhodobacteraceae bacterium]|nr:SIMPL domain-containing protein [Paracoccaceae bacterium]